MIIVCPKCSTKFDVNPDRIPDGGAKVRCARCKHVFPAEKALEQKTPTAPVFKEEETVREEIVTDAAKQQKTPAQFQPADEVFGEARSEESEFSYDKFQELDSSAAEENAVESDAENENFFSDNQEATTASSDAVEEEFTFTDSSDKPPNTIEKVFAAEKDNKKTIVEPPTAHDEEAAGTSIAAEELPVEPEFPSQPAPEKKGSSFAGILKFLLLLILGVLIIGGILIYMNGPDQLNQTIQHLLGQQIDRPVQTGRITLVGLEGKFIQNEQAGELFLIRGEAINNFDEPRSAIQIKGIILDQNSKPLLQKTVFCGNPISDQELQTLAFSELEKIMGNQFGKELSNMKIDSKQSIPFDIVFKDLPKNLSEFSVKVTSSKPTTK